MNKHQFAAMKRTAISAAAALLFSTACIGAAIGPGAGVEKEASAPPVELATRGMDRAHG